MAETTRDDAEHVGALRQTDEPALEPDRPSMFRPAVEAATRVLPLTPPSLIEQAVLAALKAALPLYEVQLGNRLVPELTEELLHTLPVPIAAAVHQLKIARDGERRRANAAERRQEELRAELKQVRADQPQLTDEYGLLIHHLDTTTSEGTIAPTLAEALEVLADFDASSGPGVLSRTLRVRPVGPWKDAREAGRG